MLFRIIFSFVSRETYHQQDLRLFHVKHLAITCYIKQTGSPLPNCLPALMWGVKEKDMGYMITDLRPVIR